MSFTLPELGYDYAALSPAISEAIMRLHHQKHHQTYVDKLNAALQTSPEYADWSLERLLTELTSLPEAIRPAVRNHGGGHYNHSLFWQCMAPNVGGEPSGELADAIAAKYGSFAEFTQQFNTAALGVFGSGWVWLMPDLTIVSSANQDSPLSQSGAEPVMGLDVWEHAYYLDYQNKRDGYVQAWWSVVNWEFIQRRYQTLRAA